MCSKDSYLHYMDRSDILHHSDILYDDDRKLQSAIDNYNERVNEKYQVINKTLAFVRKFHVDICI